MRFLNPAAFWLTALLFVLLLLHVLQRPWPSYWVANRYLWPQASEQHPTRFPFRRRQPNCLLLLQLLFLTAVILALAQPLLFLHPAPGRRLAFVFDASASMHTLEEGSSRFASAQARALALLDRLNPNDEVLLVQAKTQPIMLGGFLSNRQTLRRTIFGLSPTHAPADLTAALLLALPVAEEVYVFSDGTANAMLPANLQRDTIHYVQIGKSADNLAISRIYIRRHPFSPSDQELFAEVMNGSNRPHTVRVVLSLGTTIVRQETMTLAPGARQAMIEPFSQQQGIVTVHIDAVDHLEVDNRAYAVLQPPPAISVLLVSHGNRFVETALDVNPLSKRTSISPAAFARHEIPGDVDIVIFDGITPPRLTHGRYVILNPQAVHVRPVAGDIATPQPHHPIMAFVDPSTMVLDGATPLRTVPGDTVLLEAAGQPIMLAQERPGLRKVICGFDLRASNVPMTVAFPILMSNILQWLLAPPGQAHSQLAAGVPLLWEVPPALGLRQVAITTPSGNTVHIALSDHTLVFEATDTIGIYTVQGPGYVRRFAVNLTNAAESNIRPVFRPETVVAPRRSQAASPQEAVGLWQYLLGAALLVLSVEWCYACRKGLD